MMLRIVCVLFLSIFTAEIHHATSADCDQLPSVKKSDPCDAKKIRFYMGDDEFIFDYKKNKFVKKSPMYHPKKQTQLIIHGIAQNQNSTLIRKLSEAYNGTFNRGDFDLNIFRVDYSDLVDPSCFDKSQSNSEYIGHCIARFFNNLKPPTFYVTAYELGASITTYVTKSYTKKIQRILALDPAYSIYGKINISVVTYWDKKSNKACFHTAGNYLAVECGNSDWYMNLGQEPMPGCPVDKNKTVEKLCSSERVLHYFIDSVKDPNSMFGFRCKYVKPNFIKYCPYQPPWSITGEFINYVLGQYQVYTNAHEPYGQGRPQDGDKREK